MSVLALLLPPRPRTSGASAPPPSFDWELVEWRYAWSADGGTIREGTARASEWPQARRVVAVLPAADVAWHAVSLPKLPASRMAQALAGQLEEGLLDAPPDTHLALGPSAEDGRRWVAAVNKAWLRAAAEAASRAGRPWDAVVAAYEPLGQAGTHSQTGPIAASADEGAVRCHVERGTDGSLEVVLRGSQGVLSLPWEQRTWISDTQWRAPWTADADAAGAAVKPDGRPIAVWPWSERMLHSAAHHSNLLQFELAPAQRGSRWLTAQWQKLMAPEQARLRWALAALLLVQVLGLQATVWHARVRWQDLQRQERAIVTDTFPQIPVVLDPMVQMRRAVEALRTQQGAAGPTDLETWLDVLGAAWPAGAPGIQELEWSRDALVVRSTALTPEMESLVRPHAVQQGWTLDATPGQWRLAPQGKR